MSDDQFWSSLMKMEFGYPCSRCGAMTSDKRIAQLHKDAHFTGYSCDLCPQVFITSRIANLHKELHKRFASIYIDDSCQCKLCEGAFVSLLYLEFHLIQFHNHDVLLNPNVVQLGTKAEDTEAKSMETREKLYKCGICKSIFSHSLNLEAHSSLHDTCEYGCAKCSSVFSVLDALEQHIIVQHLQVEGSIKRKKLCLGPDANSANSPVDNCNYQSNVATLNAESSVNLGINLRSNVLLNDKKDIQLSQSHTQETTCKCRSIKIPTHEESQSANNVFLYLNCQSLSLCKTASSQNTFGYDVQTTSLDRSLPDDRGYQQVDESSHQMINNLDCKITSCDSYVELADDFGHVSRNFVTPCERQTSDFHHINSNSVRYGPSHYNNSETVFPYVNPYLIKLLAAKDNR